MADTYNDYPKAASENAKRALKFREETDNKNDCGTPVGWARANQLAKGEGISADTVKRMASFNRHRQNKDVPYEEGCGGLMWDAWGGTEGVDWAIRKSEQIDKEAVKNMTEIDIIGAIDQYTEANAQSLKAELENANGLDVTFNIASEGGSYFEGLTMAAMISSYKGKTTAKGIGIVASAATVVFLAADEKVLTSNSFFMIHSAWSGAEGNAKQISKTVELLNRVDEQMVNIYTAQMESKGKLINNSIEETKAFVRNMMSEETWLTAEEAVDYGFADYIMDEAQIPDYKSYEAVFNRVRAESKFKNIPKIKNSMNDKKSLLQNIASVFGFKAEIVEEKDMTVIEEPKAEEMEIEIEKSFDDYTPEEKIEYFRKKIAELEAEKEAMSTEMATMKEKVKSLEHGMKEKEVVIEEKTKEVEEAQAKAFAKISYKSESAGTSVKNKFTQDQIIQASSFIKSLLNK
jgi:ATP-dependent protease ClpP protease subunit